MKYKDWLMQWLEIYMKPTVKNHTFEHYWGIVNKKIIPALGDYELETLRAEILQKFTAELCKCYSANTVGGIVSVLKNSLKTAHRIGVIDNEYTDSILMPKVHEKEVSCFSLIEQKKIENAVLNSGKDSLFGIILCLYTGLRIGELMGLQWKNIDLQKGLLFVKYTANDVWGGANSYIKQLDVPKTDSSK